MVGVRAELKGQSEGMARQRFRDARVRVMVEDLVLVEANVCIQPFSSSIVRRR